MTKIYRGDVDYHPPYDTHVTAAEEWNEGRTTLPLKHRLDLANHSPSGLSWGYSGSGPAQLALAILADCLQDDKAAVKYHHPFMWDVIERLDKEKPFTLTEKQIRDWLADYQAKEEGQKK